MKRNLILPLFILIFAILFTWLLLYPNRVNSGLYLDSAHGNTSYGVNRTSLSIFGYSIGNCAHCHEQHASIDGSEPSPVNSEPSNYLLFDENFISQSQDFCFDCHKGAGSLQVSFNRKNYNYSYWFGGDHVNHTTPDNIYDAFNPSFVGCCQSSAHNLQDILNFVKKKWPDTFKDESNPCNACHNPHLAQRGYPVVRPTDRNNIWGDEPNEKMSFFASSHGGQYQAPFWYNSTTQYEPDGSSTTDGSNVPDYVTFCSDCHNGTDIISSSTSLTPAVSPSDCSNCAPRNLNRFDWFTQDRSTNSLGDYHGSIARCFDVDGTSSGQWRSCGLFRENNLKAHPHPPDYYTDECETQSVGNLYQRDPACAADSTDLDNDCNASNGQVPDGVPDNIECGYCNCVKKDTKQGVPYPVWWGAIKKPYETANHPNFILNCTDCHEPHGSVLPYLLRKTVNGKYEINTGGPGPTPSWDQLFCATCHYHFQDKTVQTYVPEFDLTVSSNGWHCGGPGSCINCHQHASVDRCWACTYCAVGVHGHTF